jgi:hypothetical protein
MEAAIFVAIFVPVILRMPKNSGFARLTSQSQNTGTVCARGCSGPACVAKIRLKIRSPRKSKSTWTVGRRLADWVAADIQETVWALYVPMDWFRLSRECCD